MRAQWRFQCQQSPRETSHHTALLVKTLKLKILTVGGGGREWAWNMICLHTSNDNNNIDLNGDLQVIFKTKNHDPIRWLLLFFSVLVKWHSQQPSIGMEYGKGLTLGCSKTHIYNNSIFGRSSQYNTRHSRSTTKTSTRCTMEHAGMDASGIEDWGGEGVKAVLERKERCLLSMSTTISIVPKWDLGFE